MSQHAPRALDSYEERYGSRRLRDAAPGLRSEMDDTIEAIEDRLRALRPADYLKVEEI